MANTYLTRTFSNTPTSDKICTISTWFKRGNISSEQVLFSYLNSSSKDALRFESNDIVRLFLNGTLSADLQSNSKYRDTSAWYHIVVAIDTTQATASDRVKIWFNNEQVTSFAVETYPSQNYVIGWGSARACNIGRDVIDLNKYFDGSISHFHFIDGTAYDATAFGEYDANGVWKINASPSVTYGTNGFFILKNGNSVTDQSGNTNNFTVGGGTLTNTEDSPSNVFATFNALYNSNQNLSNGNLSATNTTSTWNSRASTLAGSSGKYYAEYKINKPGTSYHMNGVGDIDYINPSSHAGAGTGMVAYYSDSGEKYISGTNTAYGDTYGDGDIISVALDLDNGYVYFAKNGTWQNSGVPTSGATGTGGIVLPTTGTYAFTESVRSASSSNAQVDANFGNGYFGTTTVASAGTNASGNGIFEYDCPDGYTALSTKGLNL